jgi:hypothetical protein
VTGLVTLGLELRREHATMRVAIRLVEAELSLAAASADWRIEQEAWSPWNFESTHRVWGEYRAALAQALDKEEWSTVIVAIFGVDMVERRFEHKPLASKLDPEEVAALGSASKSFYDGANAARRRQGLKEIAP